MIKVAANKSSNQSGGHVKDHVQETVNTGGKLADFCYPSQASYEMCERFMLFRDQCVRELAVENLMFWVEFIQLLQFLIDYNNNNDNNANNNNSKNDCDGVNIDDSNLIAPLGGYYSTKHLTLKETRYGWAQVTLSTSLVIFLTIFKNKIIYANSQSCIQLFLFL